ncbi:MAG TPA: terminase family protein [Hyphomonadaceae bacterium]|nr:terminase family protein [Hyphomonadaceae bacterium]
MERLDGQVLIPTAGNVRPEGEASDRRKRRRKYPEEVWALAEAEYFGGARATEIRAKYGMSLQTIYARMAGRGKRAQAKEVREARATSVAPAPRPLTEEEAVRLFREVVALGCQGAAEKLRAQPVKVETRERDGKIDIRLHHSEETWAQARRDYEIGNYTKPAIAERYGMNDATVKKRSSKGKWSKTFRGEITPLKAEDDPAQVEQGEDGKSTSAWLTIAHPAQLPPETAANGGPWRTWLFQGGRGAGKTRAGAEWLAGLAEETPRGIFALVGATENDVRRVMIDGVSGLMNLPGRAPCRYEPSLKRITWKDNGAVAHVFSAEEPDRLRGPQFMAAWADEFAAWPRPEHTLAMLRMGLRLKGLETGPLLVVTTTPKPIAALRKLRGEGSCAVTLAPTAANAANLHGDFLAGLSEIYGGTRLERQELMGELLDGEGALWRREWIVEGARPARLERVAVAVDPPAGMGGVCGIVAAGRVGEQGFVLEDASIAGASPAGWARRVAETAARHGAARIVVETNQGGDMVRAVLAGEDMKARIEEVYAKLGKRARAEPIAALYEKGRIVHCGAFKALEEEMMALGGEGGRVAGERFANPRFDRVDALVWALSDLLGRKRPMPGIF